MDENKAVQVQGWIDAGVEVPENMRDVLVWREGASRPDIGFYGCGGGWRVYTGSGMDIRWDLIDDARYWMRFPNTLPDGTEIG